MLTDSDRVSIRQIIREELDLLLNQVEYMKFKEHEWIPLTNEQIMNMKPESE